MGSGPVDRRRWIIISSVIMAIVFLGLGVRAAYRAYVIAPGLASDDPAEFMAAYMSAARFGFAVPGETIGIGAFLASDVEVSEPAYIPMRGEHDSEVRFVVDYVTPWRSGTGEAPGPRRRFVYLGRDGDGPWTVIGGGTGP